MKYFIAVVMSCCSCLALAHLDAQGQGICLEDRLQSTLFEGKAILHIDNSVAISKLTIPREASLQASLQIGSTVYLSSHHETLIADNLPIGTGVAIHKMIFPLGVHEGASQLIVEGSLYRCLSQFDGHQHSQFAVKIFASKIYQIPLNTGLTTQHNPIAEAYYLEK